MVISFRSTLREPSKREALQVEIGQLTYSNKPVQCPELELQVPAVTNVPHIQYQQSPISLAVAHCNSTL